VCNLFDDSILVNPALLDRLAHNAPQMIIEGGNYRKKEGNKEEPHVIGGTSHKFMG
jgi:DNA replication protein DnaC